MLPDSLVNRLVDTFGPPLRRYAESLTRDSDLADDLVQEAFIQAAAHAGQLAGLSDFQRRAWLYKVVRNRFIDLARARKRRRELLEELARTVAGEEPSGVLAGEINLFERLPERFRELLIERYVQGLTSEAMAARRGIPAATVRSRLRLAINWLRTHTDEWF